MNIAKARMEKKESEGGGKGETKSKRRHDETPWLVCMTPEQCKRCSRLILMV